MIQTTWATIAALAILVNCFFFLLFTFFLYKIISTLNKIESNTELSANYISKLLDLNIEGRYVKASKQKGDDDIDDTTERTRPLA